MFDPIISTLNIAKTLALVFLAIVLIIYILKSVHDKLPGDRRLKMRPRAKAEGIVFGSVAPGLLACSPSNEEGHIFVMGGSGSGKTSALLIPTLRTWTGGAFIIDISGDISYNCDTPDKMIFAPDDICTIPYNIFAPIDALGDRHDTNTALEQLAHILLPTPINGSDATIYFTTEGRKILTAALISGYHSNKDFIAICDDIVNNSYISLFRMIDASGVAEAKTILNSFEGCNEKNIAGAMQNAANAVSIFSRDFRLRNAIRRPYPAEEFYTPGCMEDSQVFVTIPDNKLDIWAPLLHLITAQTLQYIGNRPLDDDRPILIAIDEFASMGKLDIIAALQKARKRHTRIMILTQSLADLDLIYGKAERMSMMANFVYKVILSASDSDTQEYFAKLIGHNEKTKDTYTGGMTPSSTTTEKDWIIQPEDLAHLGKDKLILLHRGGHSILRKNYFWKDHIL